MNILLISLLGCLVVALPSASAQKVKWCVKTQKELDKCKHLATKSPDLECFRQPSITDCIKSIEKGEVDAVTVDGQHVYFGGLKPYELRPIIAEKNKKESCYAVAVVKPDTQFSIKDLKGKRSCHGCYQTSGGWNLPIGSLVKDRIIDWDGPDDMPLEKAVSQFFSRSCVPGISKAEYPNLCAACQGDCLCQFTPCLEALQCLKKGDGDVAFICQGAIQMYIPENERRDYQLLCTDGTRKEVDQYKDCHLGKEPARAVIAHKDADSQHIYKVLGQIPDSDLFDAFGEKDLIFSDSTSGLVELPKSTDSFLYLKQDYYETMHALKAGTPPAPATDRKIQWCTISHAEQQKCDSLQIPRMECRRASSVEECIQKVMRKEADAFAADGGQVYIAGKCGLVPAMVEQYIEQSCPDGGDTSTYSVVAVVRKDSGVTWSKLRGKKSCHTGLNRNAGWKVPDSVICGKTPDCLYTFFSKGCAPGADPASTMCELCKGSGKAVGDESKCKASSAEIYYGYDGAFRCLAEKTGDVAFIKHSIVGDYTDGKGPDWAKQLKADDFELICPQSPDKTFKYSEFDACHLAKVPAHAVVTREDVRGDVVSILMDAQASKPNLFKSEGERNLLFSDSTKCLQKYTKSLEEFLTKTYKDMIEKTFETGKGVPDLVKVCTFDSTLSS
ncbi:transferrin-a [Siphateles boraxobius]|uniref:transferrin-a n=1 Tax=Siphateles boraxobius TaxID=180520 RepID=UPI004062C4A5